MSDLFDLDAEQAVLGALLFDNALMERLGALAPDDFHDPVHGRLFAEARKRILTGEAADALTLKRWADMDPGMGELGAARYLTRCLESAAPMSGQALSYADLIRDLAMRRRVADIGGKIAAAAGGGADVSELIVHAERLLAAAADACEPQTRWASLGAVMAEGIEAAQRGEAAGISTGLAALDECTGGVDGVFVIAGASSMGKSLVGQAVAINMARAGINVGFFHLEMRKTGVGLRAAAALAHEAGNRSYAHGNPTYLGARRGALTESGWSALRSAATAHANLPLYVDTRGHLPMAEIEASARRLRRRLERQGKTLDVIFIDHEGLIASSKDRRAKWEEGSDRAVAMQDLHKRLGIPVVPLVQINREGAAKSERPHMGHLANSSDWERCADVICLLYREAYYAQRKPDDECDDADFAKRRSNALEIIVDKSRDGERKTVHAFLDVRTGFLAEAPSQEAQRRRA